MRELRLAIMSAALSAVMVLGVLCLPSTSGAAITGAYSQDGAQIEPDIANERALRADMPKAGFNSEGATPSKLTSVAQKSNYSAPLSSSQWERRSLSSIQTEELAGNEPAETISTKDLRKANKTDQRLDRTVMASAAGGQEPVSSLSALYEQYVLAPQTEDMTSKSRWVQSNHRDIAYYVLTTHSANDFVDSRWWGELIDHCDDPDNQDWLKEEHYLHNLFGTDADEKVVDLSNKAIAHFRNGELGPGYEDLAFASHFMMDLGSPWHRDAQALLYHAQFEDWVSSNWNSLQLYMSCRNQVPSNWMAANPTKTLEQFAEYLNDVVYTQYGVLYHYIRYRHSNDYNNFVASVKYCLSITAQFTSALYAYVAPHAMLLDYVIDPYPYAEVHGVGHTEKIASFTSSKFQIHLDLWNTATYGDTSTDYLYVYVYWYDGYSRTTFTNLPMTNGGHLQYDCVVSNSQYASKKVQSIEIVWHQWTTGSWSLWDGEGWTTATVVSDGFGVTQTQATYYQAVGKSFGYDSDWEHELAVMPVTKVSVHLEMYIQETYGDRSTDYLYVDVYYEDGTYHRYTFTDLPGANGGTVIYNCQMMVDTDRRVVDHFEFLWYQWTWGQSTGHSWSIQGKTTFYWDTGAPGSYPT